MKALRMLRDIWLVGVVCAVSAWAQPDWAAASQRAVLRADWATVAEVAQQWKQHDPNATTADWLLGYSGLATGDYNRALAGFSWLDDTAKTRAVLDYASKLANQNPENAVAQMLKGDVLARTGDYAAALTALDAALSALDNAERFNSRRALIYDVRGVVRAMAGKPEDALADFEQAVELDRQLADTHANAGLVLLAIGSPSSAVESLTQALELAPNFALAYNGRGVAYALMEAWDEAETDFKKAAELAPGCSFAAGNKQFLSWIRGQIALRQSLQDGTGDGRGSTLIAQSYEHRVEDTGNGKMMDVFIIKATPLTSTFEGMRAVVQDITRQLRSQSGKPDTWQPRFHLDAHGWRSTPIGQMPYAIRMAQQADRDAIIAMDLSPWFKWQKSITWDQNVKKAAPQIALAGAAINAETRIPATGTFNSGAGQSLIWIGKMLDRGELKLDVANHLRFANPVVTAYPFQERLGKDETVSKALLARIEGNLYNLHTTPGYWSNRLAPTEKVINIQVTDSNGRGIWHGNFNDLTLHGRPNPVLQVGAAALRGLEPEKVQYLADQLGRQGRTASGSLQSLQRPIPVGVGPLQNNSWKKYSALPPNSPPPGPPPNYRLSSTAMQSSPGDKRRGVKLKADVVINQPADTSDWFGSETSEKATVATEQQGLLSPFLLFCATPATRK